MFNIDNNPPTAVSTITGNTTLNQQNQLVQVDTTGGDVVITLPDARTCLGKIYVIKRITAGINALTVASVSSQTLDGVNITAVPLALATQWSCRVMQSNGVNWINWALI